MEAAWERSVDYARLDLSDINARLEFAGVQALAADLIPQGHANTNYSLTLADGRRGVLRIYQRTSETIELEAAVMARMRDLPGVPVPEVLAVDRDAGLMLLEFCPGRSIESLIREGNDTEVHAAIPSIAHCLRALAGFRLSGAGFLNSELKVEQPWTSATDGYLDYALHRLQRPLAAQNLGAPLCASLTKRLEQIRSRLRAVEGDPCLVHGDFKASNLLIANGELSSVLDWEFVHSGTWLFSVAQLVRHQTPTGIENALERELPELPADWRMLVRALDVVNLADMSSREGIGPALVSDIRELLEKTAALLNH